ncbi:tryptophan dimethylallyltransferase-domain-containing protein [Xylariaceae sp. AK1471]|nr:tryptophan dimethylallyltransferase-domain-containing protein [Xylariaceae sp. AK1471]
MAVEVCYTELSVWQQKNPTFSYTENIHHRLWCQHVGKALGTLLFNAGYSSDVQYRSLEFFTQLVAPNLGAFPAVTGDYTQSWHSFMTDDGCPVELSWDWGTSDFQPTIRYSMEPIGLHAGTSSDPDNLLTGPAFQDQLIQLLPDMRLEWFNHFGNFFNDRGDGDGESLGIKDHNSSIFYAFDLSEGETTAKVYFFLKYRAMSRKQSNLEVLSEAINSAPHSTEGNLHAFSKFSQFLGDASSVGLENEMVAIDLIDPLESRFKIYFRSRETTFDSVINIMTLGGRTQSPKLQQGLEDLHCLWNALFGVYPSRSHPLKEVSHRTAGILYNVEFRLGDEFPVAKIYLPVRHYSQNDGAVIRALDKYFQSHQRGSYMTAYTSAMTELFGSKSLVTQSGIQTYVGCTIRPNGTLRVVSYFKPPLSEPLASFEEIS